MEPDGYINHTENYNGYEKRKTRNTEEMQVKLKLTFLHTKSCNKSGGKKTHIYKVKTRSLMVSGKSNS